MDAKFTTYSELDVTTLVAASGKLAGVPVPAVASPTGSYGPKVTAPTMTKFSWSNADVVGFGAVQLGNLKVCTLPKGFYLTRAFVVLRTQASGVTTLGVSLGTAATAYTDLIASQDGLGAPGTFAAGTISDATVALAADLDVYAQFLSSTGAETLDSVVASSGDFYIEGLLLP